MNFSPWNLLHPASPWLALGTVSLIALLVFQAFGVVSAANASSRDEFPGRRQGGGTHWIQPSARELNSSLLSVKHN